jgi:AcrR family transcriptional regulator
MGVDPNPRGQDGPRARNRRGEGDRLRRQLVEAAGRLLEAGATHETLSLRSVAREVGVAATSVYLHFADRTELLIAVYRERFAELSESMREAITRAGDDPGAQLRALCLAYHAFALDHPQAYRVLFDVLGVRTETPTGLARDELPGVDMFDAVRGCLARCIDAGLAPAADSFLATVCLIATLHGMVSLRIARPSFPWPPVEHLVDHVLVTQVGLRA